MPSSSRSKVFSNRIGILVALALAVAAIALLVAQPWKQPPPVKAAQLGASLELAAGEVLLEVGDDEQTRVLSGTPLPEGARLLTREGARALVRLGDGTRAFLRDGTSVVLGDGISLERGAVWLEAPPLERGQSPRAHQLGASSVALSDGGASLTLSEAKAEVYVAEGLAIVTTPGGRTEVDAGERAVIEGQGAPTVSAVAFWDDWTGGMGDRSVGGAGRGSASGSLYAVDREAPPGAPSLPLTIARQTVKVAIEDGVAETLVDQRFFNPSSRDVEGWYWFSIPDGAQLISFALETDGQLIEGEVVERKQASQTYERAVERKRDPALLEWIDAQTVRARIYPVPSLGERRVVTRYQQLLSEAERKLRYHYPLAPPRGKEAPIIEEFSLAVELRGKMAEDYVPATLGQARVEDDGRRLTVRRSGYTPRADFELELSRKPQTTLDPVRLNLVDPGADHARFVMVRYSPDLDFDAVPPPRGELVVVVDTSAAGDMAEHQSKLAVAEALLRTLSDGDRFAIMRADVASETVYPEDGLTDASTEAIASALEAIGGRRPGGATDLGAIFERALELVHGLEQPAIVYVGDGFATSGERDGDALAERVRRSMAGSRARLFAVGVGTEVDMPMLTRLARVGGGDAIRVAEPEEAVARALQLAGALKTPTITDLEVDMGEGLDDPFFNVAGKLSRGQELVLVARTHHDLPNEITVRGRLGGKPFEKEYSVERDRSLVDRLVPRLWAATYVERLLGDPRGPLAVRGKILSLGLEYGLMTPFTSLLALDSEQAYASMGIERRKRPLTDLKLIAEASPPEKERAGVLVGLLAALSSPLGCGSEDKTGGMEVVAQAEPAEARHRGEEGGMGQLGAKEKSGLYAVKGPKDEVLPQSPAAVPPPPEEAAQAAKNDEQDAWGGLAGSEVGEAYGVGGLGLVGAGRGGGGEGEGTIGLGNTGLIGKGGGGGTGSGYGRGSGAGFGGRGKAVPRVRMAKPEVKGTLDNDIVRRIVRAHINEVRYCYNQGLVGDPGLEGRVSVQFTIGPTGEVPAAVVEKSTVEDENVAMCIAKAVKRWKFPKPSGGGTVEVTYPFALSSDGGSSKAAAPATTPETKPAEPEKPAEPARVAKRPARKPKEPCSDASARSLAHRKILWEGRLAMQPTMAWALNVYEASAASCEIKGWKDERVFLQLLQKRANTEDDIVLVLDHFRGEPEARNYVARALLRRLVDPSLVATVEASLFGFAINWIDVDRKIALVTKDADAIKILEEALARSPGAPRGEERLIKLLAASGKISEALSRGNRLRERGLLTPALVQTIGEVLVADGRERDALRLFSEIVEFDPQSPASRRLLGDVFLRHGWFEDAYRQYSDLVHMVESDPSAEIRMARAAAGTGRVDEALRILRKLAAGEGRPGADDPRRWARLHSAAYLARLLSDTSTASPDSVARELKRLQVFDAPTAWALLTWEDMDARLIARAEDESTSATENAVDAGATGLFAVQRAASEDTTLQVRHKGAVLDRDVRYVLTTIRWDGSKFAVASETGEIPQGKASASDAGAAG